MAPAGVECFVGGRRDPAFGPVIVAGLGGVFVEIFQDTSVRLAPVTPNEAADMLRKLKSYPLLEGARGKAPADVEALIDVICRISALLAACPDLAEIDLNPSSFIPGTGCVARRRPGFSSRKKRRGLEEVSKRVFTRRGRRKGRTYPDTFRAPPLFFRLLLHGLQAAVWNVLRRPTPSIDRRQPGGPARLRHHRQMSRYPARNGQINGRSLPSRHCRSRR
jgi:hypothetical protein